MTSSQEDRYPNYAALERRVDGAVHLTGLVAAFIAILVCLSIHSNMLSAGALTALTIYWIGLIAMLAVSFCYHMTPWERFRAPLRRADHATIFLKIAGTYTPIVIALGNVVSYAILALVWALALLGAVKKLFLWRRPGRLNAMLYLGLGWISLGLIYGLFQLSPAAGWCVVVGGLLYTGGTVFHHWEGLNMMEICISDQTFLSFPCSSHAPAIC